MTRTIRVSDYIQAWEGSPFTLTDDLPWYVTHNAEYLVREAMAGLSSDYCIDDGVAVHRLAIIETGAVLKGPAIIGPKCFIASGAYLRGGVYLAEGCTLGPGSEIKSSFVFAGSAIAHFNFVGDSLVGAGVNVEAGAIIANYRNELADKSIRILADGYLIETGVDKFGALIGDGCRIGANAVVAPGALLLPESRVGRLQLIDQYPG